MSITIGLLENIERASVFKLHLKDKSVEHISVDLQDLSQISFNLLVTNVEDDNAFSALSSVLDQQKSYYPIVNLKKSSSAEINLLKSKNGLDVLKFYENHSARPILLKNIESIEQICPFGWYLKDLWSSDRHTCLEELWYFIKTNLNTSFLRIIFNDIQTEELEKNKPKLSHSSLQGEKSPDFIPGGDEEIYLMKEYENVFAAPINIQEYNPEKGELVCAALINNSPLIIMCRLYGFNYIQKAVLVSLMTGMQNLSSTSTKTT